MSISLRRNAAAPLRRIAAAIILSALLLTCIAPARVEAAVGKPGKLRFVQWEGTSFSSCTFEWDHRTYANGFQIRTTWTDGSHAVYSDWKLDKGDTDRYTRYMFTLNNTFEKNHVNIVKVRAYVTGSKGRKTYSAWSNAIYITPCPARVTYTLPSGGGKTVRLKWDPVYGSNGYNVFLTTNPAGSWKWNQATAQKARASSATIRTYKGSRLKSYQNYYARVITRRKEKGEFQKVPLPSSRYYSCRFRINR